MPTWGIRAHDLGRRPAEDLARAVGDRGLTCVQLALHKALPGFEPVAGALTPKVAQAVARAFADQGVSIAVLGCYIDPVAGEPEALEAGLLRFEELLRHARAFGCPVVATETGVPIPDSEAVFDRLVASFRRLARVAEAEGVRIGVEGVAHHHTVCTHDLMDRLLASVGSPSLGVVYDPANFLATDDEGHLGEAVDDALTRFGPRLVALHAKDCRIFEGTKIGDLPAGTGDVPWAYLFRGLEARGLGHLPVLLEDTGPATLGPALAYLRDAWSRGRGEP